jgi:hypothetical protein
LPIGAGAAFMLQRSMKQPIALVAGSENAPPPPRPAPPHVTIPAAPPTFAPEPVHRSTVQFTFSVVPKNAEIRVDNRKVKAGHITMPWQDKTQHKVTIHAPGYVPLTLSAPSTENRVFELRMEKAQKKPTRPPPPSHDAAPVQDL